MATIYPRTQSSARASTRRSVFTLEQLLYVVIGVLAVLLHLYLLGSRALHHDETLHAQFSWRIYVGEGYTHDPLLHGPTLYYFTALMYFLFGDNDTTARLAAALFGSALTLLPMLLRRELGRGGALLASTALLISPIALYVGRFIRHDIFAVVFEVLVVVGLLRYITSERARWHYLLAAASALMLATMETFYLFLLIVGSFVILWLLWQITQRALWYLFGYLVTVGVALTLLPRFAGIGPIPLPTEQQALDVRHQPNNNWGEYFGKVGGVVGPILRHPAVLVVLIATVLLLVALYLLIWRRRDAEELTTWRRAVAVAEPGTLLHAVARIPGRQWALAFALAFVIYAVFYTGLLSNLVRPNFTGLVTGVSGSFLYWLGQHGVRRGGQPGQYYLFQLALYEPLLVISGVAGLVLTLRRFVRSRREFRAVPEDAADGAEAMSPSAPWIATARAHTDLFTPALLSWWTIGALVVYSWAGEKMPWLTLHLVVPLCLLGGWAVARMVNWVLRGPRHRYTPAVIGGALILGTLCLIQLNTISMAMADRPEQVARAGLWPLLFIIIVLVATLLGALLGTLTTNSSGNFGGEAAGRGALLVAGTILLCVLLPYTVRSSLRLSFRTGDIPVEPLVFVQTSPDVARVMDDLERARLLYGSRRPFDVRYDNETVWQWYLRDFKGEGNGQATFGVLPETVQAVFLLQENVESNRQNLDEFVEQRYPLRWWLPECDVYRFPTRDSECGPNPTGSSLLSRVLSQPFNGQTVVDWWQYAIYRKLPGPLGSSDWTLFVRREVAPMFRLSGVPEE